MVLAARAVGGVVAAVATFTWEPRRTTHAQSKYSIRGHG
jgi:hypothetical protein